MGSDPSSPQPAAADSPLRHPSFVAFWGVRVASGFSFQILSVAVGWQVYALTGRALDLGLIGLVQFVPAVLLALPAGHWAEVGTAAIKPHQLLRISSAAISHQSGGGHRERTDVFRHRHGVAHQLGLRKIHVLCL